MKNLFLSAIVTLCLGFAGCSDDESVLHQPTQVGDIYGTVSDKAGGAIEGVVVSDGFSCTKTDAAGRYKLTCTSDSFHVYISIPAAYAVPIVDGLPCFWQKIKSYQTEYNFSLMAAPVESEFNLICIGDPQCQNDTHIARFRNETAVDIKATVAAMSVPCYAITMGDVNYNSDNDYSNNTMPLMFKALHQDVMGVPVFNVMGNHDNKAKAAISAESSSIDLDAQRNFEYKFGPVNYSFDRGNAHIIAMDYIISQAKGASDYSLGFKDSDLEWLRQDLSYVDKSKLIIFCAHIPLRNATATNVKAVIDLLSEFASVHIMTGHTHYAQNFESYTTGNIFEHVHGAACGAWWWSTVNVDGTPNGYAVYNIKESQIADWYYKAVGYDKEFQLRMYKAPTMFAGYGFPQFSGIADATANDTNIIANVWNTDSKWKVEVYENNVLKGQMTRYNGSDAWAIGYHVGVVGRSLSSYSPYDEASKKLSVGNYTHMYYYTPTDPAAAIKIVATDRFGHTYTQSVTTTAAAADYPSGY